MTSDLGNLLGNRSLGSKILRGEWELSKTRLRILADRFKIHVGLFLLWAFKTVQINRTLARAG